MSKDKIEPQIRVANKIKDKRKLQITVSIRLRRKNWPPKHRLQKVQGLFPDERRRKKSLDFVGTNQCQKFLLRNWHDALIDILVFLSATANLRGVTTNSRRWLAEADGKARVTLRSIIILVDVGHTRFPKIIPKFSIIILIFKHFNSVVRAEERFAVLSTQLLHTNLAVLHYTVFFQMCRAHAIGWDVRNKVGSLFTLMDTVKRENIGMICVGHDLQDRVGNSQSFNPSIPDAPNWRISAFEQKFCKIETS